MFPTLRCIPTYVCIVMAVALEATGAQQHRNNNNNNNNTKQQPRKNSGSGCRDGSTEAFQDARHPQLAACRGSWPGHIGNASAALCSPGWTVCGWEEDEGGASLLRRITWLEATTLPGCYAINAAQDDNRCRPCADDVRQDDLGGVGSGCSHRIFGASSCISGGRVDVSCCEDSRFRRACQFLPGLTTGALCCRLPGVSPRIVVHPKRYSHAVVGSILVLSCRASGSPEPRIRWIHNGRPITDRSVPRLSVFDSGYLIISDAQPLDSGRYQCLASNKVGTASASATVIVTEYPSGCADGTTDGLFRHEEIHACRGRWEGHVKRGRALCTSGWQVCNPRHVSLLKLLTWSESVETDGCYAYNAANSLSLCSPCYDAEMAGIGKHCGLIRSSHSSCLAEGRIDVHADRSSLMKCNYTKGVTTGILCCKKPEKWQQAAQWTPRKCQHRCRNGGVCADEGRCKCAQGYKGNACQTPICPGGCIPNSTCVKPRLCRCNSGFSGPNCSDPDVPRCHSACANGGRCVDGRCKCPQHFRGSNCRRPVHSGSNSTAQDNRTKPLN